MYVHGLGHYISFNIFTLSTRRHVCSFSIPCSDIKTAGEWVFDFFLKNVDPLFNSNDKVCMEIQSSIPGLSECFTATYDRAKNRVSDHFLSLV